MAKVTISNNVSGQIDGNQSVFATTKTYNVKAATDASFLVGASWRLVASVQGIQTYVIALINEGTEDAIYRYKTGTDYTRFTLPAGAATVVILNGVAPLGNEVTAGLTGYELSVYSANGTTIRAIVAA